MPGGALYVGTTNRLQLTNAEYAVRFLQWFPRLVEEAYILSVIALWAGSGQAYVSTGGALAHLCVSSDAPPGSTGSIPGLTSAGCKTPRSSAVPLIERRWTAFASTPG